MGESRDPVDVVRRLDGQARTAEIVAVSGRHRLHEAVEDGRLLRVTRGVYVLPRLPRELALAAQCRGVVSHGSAAAIWRLEQVQQPSTVHVTVPHGTRRRPREGVTLHHSRHLQPLDVDQGVTTPLRTVLDCAASMPFEHALAIADSALAQRLVHAEPLLAAALARSGPGRQRIVRVAEAADRRAENPFESVLRARLLDARIPGFEPQLRIRHASGVAVVDLADPVLRIVLEADSYRYHGDRQAFARDCQRYNALVLDGWTVLRFSWEQVMYRPGMVVDAVRAVRARLQERRRQTGARGRAA